jgi:hypothetical protein
MHTALIAALCCALTGAQPPFVQSWSDTGLITETEVTKVNGESTRLPKWKDRFEALPGGKVRELPEVHGLYRNDGKGHFTPIQFEPGVFLNEDGKPIPPYRDWGLGVMFRDINGDGAPDIYVCNDFASPDRVWMNTGKGTFRAINSSVLRHTSRSSMGIDFADIDRDGHDDFIVVDMLAREHGKRMMQLVKDDPNPGPRERIEEQPSYNRNTLFFGRPDGSFAEAAFMAGVAATDWSWLPVTAKRSRSMSCMRGSMALMTPGSGHSRCSLKQLRSTAKLFPASATSSLAKITSSASLRRCMDVPCFTTHSVNVTFRV